MTAFTVDTTAYATIARDARRHGYEATSASDVHVFCPLCHEKVAANPAHIAGRAGNTDVAFPALDAAMADHLSRHA